MVFSAGVLTSTGVSVILISCVISVVVCCGGGAKTIIARRKQKTPSTIISVFSVDIVIRMFVVKVKVSFV